MHGRMNAYLLRGFEDGKLLPREFTPPHACASNMFVQVAQLLRARPILHAAQPLPHCHMCRATAEAREAELKSQLALLQRDCSTAARAAKPTDTSALEVRLHRALEEVERYKAEVAGMRMSAGESAKETKAALTAAQLTIKKLEKQKADLVTAFKKQLKLIDILKRQRIHVSSVALAESNSLCAEC